MSERPTNQRPTTPSVDRTDDGIGDPEISALYREIATERTPADLDRAVLKAAAVRPEPRTWNRWARPAAWAATIGLSLAIVLEQTVFNAPAVIDPAELTNLPAPDGPAEANGDGAFTDSASATTLRESTDERAAARERAPAISSEALAAPDTGMLEQAEERARLRQDANLPAGAARLRSVAAEAFDADDTGYFCDAGKRRSPESWLACILDLERRGLSDPARAEREALERTFPDFVLPESR